MLKSSNFKRLWPYFPIESKQQDVKCFGGGARGRTQEISSFDQSNTVKQETSILNQEIEDAIQESSKLISVSK